MILGEVTVYCSYEKLTGALFCLTLPGTGF